MPDQRSARPAAERTATIVCVVVGVIAVLAVLGIGLWSSDTVTGPTSALPGGGGGGGQSNDVPVPGNGRSSSSGQKVDVAGLKAHFPVPPAATRTTLPGGSAPGEKDYVVHAALASIKSFYEGQLPPLGVQWSDPLTTTDGNGTVVGWHGSLYAPSDSDFDGTLSIDDDFLGSQPGVVTIEIMID